MARTYKNNVTRGWQKRGQGKIEKKDTHSLYVWLLGIWCCFEMRNAREEEVWSPGGEDEHELDLRSWKKCPLSSPMCKTAKHNSLNHLKLSLVRKEGTGLLGLYFHLIIL